MVRARWMPMGIYWQRVEMPLLRILLALRQPWSWRKPT